ncbi:MAG: hypothetical protein R3346_03365 [Candidatus Spechtbacterales bacterium]|nr:hypothetical protein [Candidatus Spechtbacterales bacterium]
MEYLKNITNNKPLLIVLGFLVVAGTLLGVYFVLQDGEENIQEQSEEDREPTQEEILDSLTAPEPSNGDEELTEEQKEILDSMSAPSSSGSTGGSGSSSTSAPSSSQDDLINSTSAPN